MRSSFPDAPLTLSGPGTGSGTFNYFTEAIMGDSDESRADYTASEDDVLVQGVSRDVSAIGYFGLAYFEENRGRLSAVSIDGGDGAVAPSPETVNNGTYQPLSRFIFTMSARQPQSAQRFATLSASTSTILSWQAKSAMCSFLAKLTIRAGKNQFRERQSRHGVCQPRTVGVSILDLLRLEGAQ